MRSVRVEEVAKLWFFRFENLPLPHAYAVREAAGGGVKFARLGA